MVTETWVQAGLSPTKRWKCFGGDQLVFAHDSSTTGTRMEFSVYVPPQAAKQPWPVLFYLSGLTCTWENATTKAGFQHAAAEHGMVIVAPDTSPRGDDVPDDAAYDLGKGAGFYLNATQAPWSKHFKMYDYVVQELTELVARAFPVNFARFGITGHSMGGHGALTWRSRIRTASSRSPPSRRSSRRPRCRGAQKAFNAYLGPDQKAWPSTIPAR